MFTEREIEHAQQASILIASLRNLRTVHHVRHPKGFEMEMIELAVWENELMRLSDYYQNILYGEEDV